MSRRRRDPEEGPRGFEYPEFDEKEFIRKETISFRSALVLLAWSLVAAIVAFVVWLAVGVPTGWYAGLLIAAGMGYALRWLLPLLKVDNTHFGKKEWFGTGALFFFSWLAFFILILNPPIYDGVAPDFEVHVTPSAQEPGGTLNITLIATDNVNVDPDSLSFTLSAPDGTTLATEDDLLLVVDEIAAVWSWGFDPDQDGTYQIDASISDTAGGALINSVQTTTESHEFTVGEVLQVTMSGTRDGVGHLTSTRDAVTVTMPAELDVYEAWLQVTREDNTTTAVLLEHDEERSDDDTQEWFAQPNFSGFAQGDNHFHVHVREHNAYYLGERFAPLGPIDATLVSSQSYTVNIESPALLGEHVPDEPERRDPSIEPIPGPAPIIVLVLLITGLAWLRKKRGKRDQSAPLSSP